MIEYIKEPHTALFIGQKKSGKTHLVLELIENHYNKHFDYIIIICPTYVLSSYVLFDGIRHIIPGAGSMMISFGSQSLKIGYFSGLKSCHICQHTQKFYLSLMISSLMRALVNGDSPCQNCLYQGDIVTTTYGCLRNPILPYQKI